MARKDLSLTARAEKVRNTRRIETPVHFSKAEIKSHFVSSLNNILAQYLVADELKNNGDEDGCKLIWRSQVVLVEGLLDFYLHEISKFCLFQMFCGNWDKTEKYNSIQVPMLKVEEAISATKSNEWFFEFLNERFSRDVFLSVESMRDQLNLIGVGFADTMKIAFPRDKEETSTKDGSKIIRELFTRRNEIAHQNDRSHATAQQNDISKEYVEEYIHNVQNIIDAIHQIVERKDAEADV